MHASKVWIGCCNANLNIRQRQGIDQLAEFVEHHKAGRGLAVAQHAGYHTGHSRRGPGGSGGGTGHAVRRHHQHRLETTRGRLANTLASLNGVHQIMVEQEQKPEIINNLTFNGFRQLAGKTNKPQWRAVVEYRRRTACATRRARRGSPGSAARPTMRDAPSDSPDPKTQNQHAKSRQTVRRGSFAAVPCAARPVARPAKVEMMKVGVMMQMLGMMMRKRMKQRFEMGERQW